MKTVPFSLYINKWVNQYFIYNLGRTESDVLPNLLGGIHGVSDWIQIKPTDNLQLVPNANADYPAFTSLSGGKPYYTFWLRGHTIIGSYPLNVGGGYTHTGITEIDEREPYAYTETLKERGVLNADNNLLKSYGALASFDKYEWQGTQMADFMAYADIAKKSYDDKEYKWSSLLYKIYNNEEVKQVIEKNRFPVIKRYVSDVLCPGLNTAPDTVLNELPNYNPKNIIATPGFNTEVYNFNKYYTTTDDVGTVYVINPLIDFYAEQTSYKSSNIPFDILNNYNISGDLSFITSNDDLREYAKTFLYNLTDSDRVSIGSFNVGDRIIFGYWKDGSDYSDSLETVLEVLIGVDYNA